MRQRLDLQAIATHLVRASASRKPGAAHAAEVRNGRSAAHAERAHSKKAASAAVVKAEIKKAAPEPRPHPPAVEARPAVGEPDPIPSRSAASPAAAQAHLPGGGEDASRRTPSPDGQRPEAEPGAADAADRRLIARLRMAGCGRAQRIIGPVMLGIPAL
ncbi:hypothetical protein [Paenibacillus sp. 1P07SE]|uniref:hypothetical protein n=1 Tax=Paenibacillus sp. 1P07SE TaxID=3132209 RepID=UPI0039A4A056